MTAPRKATPRAAKAAETSAKTFSEVIIYKNESKGGQSVIYEGVNVPGRKANTRIVYLSAESVRDLGTPVRIRVTFEALPD